MRRTWLLPLALLCCNGALTHIDVEDSASTRVEKASVLEQLIGASVRHMRDNYETW